MVPPTSAQQRQLVPLHRHEIKVGVCLEARHGVVEGAKDGQREGRQRRGPAFLHVDEGAFPVEVAQPPNYLLRAALQELLLGQGIEPGQGGLKV